MRGLLAQPAADFAVGHWATLPPTLEEPEDGADAKAAVVWLSLLPLGNRWPRTTRHDKMTHLSPVVCGAPLPLVKQEPFC